MFYLTLKDFVLRLAQWLVGKRQVIVFLVARLLGNIVELVVLLVLNPHWDAIKGQRQHILVVLQGIVRHHHVGLVLA
jgi:hypothetical protein